MQLNVNCQQFCYEPKRENALKRLRERIDLGEEFKPTLLARYNDLVAQEVRKASSALW